VATNELLINSSTSITEHNILYYINNNGDIYPMPWLIFLVMALLFSTLFTLLAIRFIKPLKTDGDVAFKGKKK
jgi:predicted ABC-type sugar transport system permease subunit